MENEKGSPMKPSTVLEYLKKFASITQPYYSKDLFQNVNTLESQEDQEQMWRSVLCLHWPVDFTVSAKAHEMPVAFHEMCLLVAMKLKVRKGSSRITKTRPCNIQKKNWL